MSDCGLCNLVPEEILYEDDICAVVICYSCNVPMVVLKRHDSTASLEEEQHMRAVLHWLRSKEEQYIDDQMRSIPEHKHMHLRG